MSRKTENLVIEGITYRITQVGAETGDVILFRIGQALATSLTATSLPAMMTKLMQNLSVEDFIWVRNEMKKCSQVGIVDEAGDKRVTFTSLEPLYNEHFAGRYTAAAEWLKGAVTINFGSFFEGFLARLKAAKAAAESLSPSPTADAGSSGASSSVSG